MDRRLGSMQDRCGFKREPKGKALDQSVHLVPTLVRVLERWLLTRSITSQLQASTFSFVGVVAGGVNVSDKVEERRSPEEGSE